MSENAKIIRRLWGTTENGEEILKYTFYGKHLCVSFTNLGATVQRLTYDGTDIIFSMPDAKSFVKFIKCFMGCTVGRYAGRIANGHLDIDGEVYQLPINERNYHIHGGVVGFNQKLWESKKIKSDDGLGVEFSLLSPDGDEGYPGNLNVTVRYTVTYNDELRIEYNATTDKPTAINLTNHCYFNLTGVRPRKMFWPKEYGTNRNILISIDADHITELDGYIPTGNIIDVSGTPFDFRRGKIITEDAKKVKGMDGYDHNFVLNSPSLDKPSITAKSLISGIKLDCFTDRPGVQFFTLGSTGGSFALETQSFPDSPNHPNFPNTILRPGEVFTSTTIYKFSKE